MTQKIDQLTPVEVFYLHSSAWILGAQDLLPWLFFQCRVRRQQCILLIRVEFYTQFAVSVFRVKFGSGVMVQLVFLIGFLGHGNVVKFVRLQLDFPCDVAWLWLDCFHLSVGFYIEVPQLQACCFVILKGCFCIQYPKFKHRESFIDLRSVDFCPCQIAFGRVVLAESYRILWCHCLGA